MTVGFAYVPRSNAVTTQCRSSGGDCAFGEDAGEGSGSAGDLQPLKDVFEVGTNRVLGDVQPAGDLGVAVATVDQSDELPLSRGQGGYAAPTS